jgi:twitching motility protein PilJ
MNNRINVAEYMPALGVALSLLLLVALGSALTRPNNAASGGEPPAAVLLAAQSALLNADQVLSGDSAAFESLAVSVEQLRGADTSSLSDDQAKAVNGLTGALAAILNGRDSLTLLFVVADDLDALTLELTDRVYALQGAMTLQQQPAVTAQLERLRMLAEGLRRDVRSLSYGTGELSELTQRLLDDEMTMTQIVRGFQSGDPELGLRPVTDSETVEVLSAVSATTSAIGEKVKDVLAVADRLGAIDQIRRQLGGFITAFGTAPANVVGTSAKADRITSLLMVGTLIICLLIFAVMTWIYYRSAGMRRDAEVQTEQTERNQQAIMRLLDELSSLADGDLTVTATVTEDITGAIADSINYAIEALRELVMTLSDSAMTVDGAAKQTDGTAQQLATASQSLSKQIESASLAIARMTASIEEVSGNAERSSDVARHSVDVAHKGGDAVRRTIAGMNTIRETIQETSKRIKRLGESSQEIGNIIELINDIADQTNILALNASIQASMAGEAGRGFAVVADEVQRLAERSANATKQVEVLVRTIQTDTNEAVVSMERSTTDVVGGALLAEHAGAALEEIEQVSNQIASLVQNILGSAQEQAKAAEAVTHNMDVLQDINLRTAAGTSKTTESIRKLAELAAQLRYSVSGFRLPGSASRSDHEIDQDADHNDDDADYSDDDEPHHPDADDEVPFADQRTA